MGRLTTHVLDTVAGEPGAGMKITLYRVLAGGHRRVNEFVAGADGRAGGSLLEGAAFTRGGYRLVFAVAAYFRAKGMTLPDPPFVDEVVLDFGVADPDAHYHVPLLVSPWSYATYRGS